MTRLAVLLVLASCATSTPRPEGPVGAGKWCEEPVVAVDDRIGAPCLENIRRAADFWAREGAPLRVAPVPGEALTPGVPAPGVVQVLPDVLPPRELGRTYTRESAGCLVAAEIRLATCEVQVVAHELGHALGLLHVSDRRNLMYHEALGHFALTDAQREHVR